MLQSSVQSMQTKTQNTTVKDTKAELKLIAENATLKEANKSLKKQVKELQSTLLAKEIKIEKLENKLFGLGDEKVGCSVVKKKPARRSEAKSESSVSLECSENSETCYDSASSSESLIATVSSSKKGKVRNTSSKSSATCVAAPDLRAEKKGGNAKRETGGRQNPTPESQINRIKDRKKKLIANACQTYNTNSKSSTGTKTVCILFLIRIYEYLVALYFC